MDVRIDAEFKDLIPALSEAELAQLTESILQEGIRDALVTWQGILLDGHNRYAIATEHGLPFTTIEIALPDRDAAILWMISNQLGRRNLTPQHTKYLLGKLYWLEKKQGERTDLTSGQNVQKLETAERIASETGVGARTVRRSSDYAAAVDTIAEFAGREVKDGILQGAIAISDQDVTDLKAVIEEDVEMAKVILDVVLKESAKGQGKGNVAKEIKKVKREADIQAQQEAIANGDVVLPDGVFEVIAIDPPWPYGTKYDPDTRRAANPYPEMELSEIAGIELPAAEDCILWLWTTHKFLRYSFDLLDTWGFRDVAIVTWVKNRMGLGHWLRSQSEYCIMAVKGKPQVNLTNQTTVMRGDMREHSRKPEEFYAMVEAMCNGRKLDYFSREARAGWESFGNTPELFNDWLE